MYKHVFPFTRTWPYSDMCWNWNLNSPTTHHSICQIIRSHYRFAIHSVRPNPVGPKHEAFYTCPCSGIDESSRRWLYECLMPTILLVREIIWIKPTKFRCRRFDFFWDPNVKPAYHIRHSRDKKNCVKQQKICISIIASGLCPDWYIFHKSHEQKNTMVGGV